MSGKDENKIEQTLQEQIESLKQLIPKYFFGYDEEKLEEIIGKLLKKYGNTLATAESCTGGAIASLITTVPGSSNYFKGAIVAYENQVKTKQLMVAEPLIEQHGAVSKEVVEAMAEGCLNLLNTDFAISTSGVAGPTGGSPEKPVGTVWIAVASKEKTISEKYRFGENRERNITKSVMSALNMLRKILLDQQ
jgi:nicotinamide-nucleotide amidase